VPRAVGNKEKKEDEYEDYPRTANDKSDQRSVTPQQTYHDPIGRVVIGRARESTVAKVVGHVTDMSLKHDATLVHENQSIERIENLGRRLVNRKEDRGPCVGYFFQYLAQLYRAERIKTGGRLIQKYQGRLWRTMKVEC
jgi:hypothetical protein